MTLTCLFPTEKSFLFVNSFFFTQNLDSFDFSFFGDTILVIVREKCQLVVRKPGNVLLEIDNWLVSFRQSTVFLFANSFFFAKFGLLWYFFFCRTKLVFEREKCQVVLRKFGNVLLEIYFVSELSRAIKF